MCSASFPSRCSSCDDASTSTSNAHRAHAADGSEAGTHEMPAGDVAAAHATPSASVTCKNILRGAPTFRSGRSRAPSAERRGVRANAHATRRQHQHELERLQGQLFCKVTVPVGYGSCTGLLHTRTADYQGLTRIVSWGRPKILGTWRICGCVIDKIHSLRLLFP